MTSIKFKSKWRQPAYHFTCRYRLSEEIYRTSKATHSDKMWPFKKFRHSPGAWARHKRRAPRPPPQNFILNGWLEKWCRKKTHLSSLFSSLYRPPSNTNAVAEQAARNLPRCQGQLGSSLSPPPPLAQLPSIAREKLNENPIVIVVCLGGFTVPNPCSYLHIYYQVSQLAPLCTWTNSNLLFVLCGSRDEI